MAAHSLRLSEMPLHCSVGLFFIKTNIGIYHGEGEDGLVAHQKEQKESIFRI